jgi:hypothetical protein
VLQACKTDADSATVQLFAVKFVNSFLVVVSVLKLNETKAF